MAANACDELRQTPASHNLVPVVPPEGVTDRIQMTEMGLPIYFLVSLMGPSLSASAPRT